MNEQQEDLLAQLEYARVMYEKFEEDLAQEVRDRKHKAKEHIRSLVREARSNNVPFRKIGMSLGTSDHKSLQRLAEE